jgi:hypothetical protein
MCTGDTLILREDDSAALLFFMFFTFFMLFVLVSSLPLLSPPLLWLPYTGAELLSSITKRAAREAAGGEL